MRMVIPLRDEDDSDVRASANVWAAAMRMAFDDLRGGGKRFVSAVIFFFGDNETSNIRIPCPSTAMFERARMRARATLADRGLTPERVLAEQAQTVRAIRRGEFRFGEAREPKSAMS